MRVLTVCVTLAMVATLYLPTQWAGAQQAESFDIEKAVRGAKTRADHEAIASYYDKEGAAATAKAAEHRRLAEAYRTIAGTGHFQMEDHCQRLAQYYERVVADTAALAQAHRQMAREAAEKKP
jgi:hypothetical protein